MSTTVRSHSKINLGLHIGSPRPDGYHHLATIYQTLELHDLVTVTAHAHPQTQLTITCPDPRVPRDHRNTTWRIVEKALEALNLTAQVHIHIEKRLPIQGGLGAGSANAAAALIALETEILSALPPAERLKLAGEVGSDVPLFLLGGTTLGLNRGEEVYPLPDLPSYTAVVAAPSVGVSTPQAFRDWDALCEAAQKEHENARNSLTHKPIPDKLDQFRRFVAQAFSTSGVPGVLPYGQNLAGNPLPALVRTGLENDFETVVFPQQPSLRAIKRALEENSIYAALSGSGSSLFGLYESNHEAIAAHQRITSLGVEAHITRTLPRQEYWAAMFQD